MTESETLEIVFGHQVGPLRLGHPPPLDVISNARITLDAVHPWVDYQVTLAGSEVSFSLEAGAVVSVTCTEECTFDGVNLIGLSREDLCALLQEEPSEGSQEELSSGVHDVLEFCRHAIQVWVLNDRVALISAFADETEWSGMH